MSVSENDLRRTITRLAEAVGGFHDSLYVQKHAFYFRKMSECCNFIKVRFWDELRAMLMSVVIEWGLLVLRYFPLICLSVYAPCRFRLDYDRPLKDLIPLILDETFPRLEMLLSEAMEELQVFRRKGKGLKFLLLAQSLNWWNIHNQHSPLSSRKRKREQLFGTST